MSRPSRPGPKTATLAPGPSRARRAACTVSDPWLTSAAARSLTFPGTLCSATAGRTAYSASAPGAVCPYSLKPGSRTRSHRLYRPARHIGQAPQPVWFSATTRSPTARPLRSVPGPSAATSPDHSWPMMNGSSGGQVPRYEPATIFRSVPQIPQARTRTSTSPAPGTGVGTSATASAPNSRSRAARIGARNAHWVLPPAQPRSRGRGTHHVVGDRLGDLLRPAGRGPLRPPVPAGGRDLAEVPQHRVDAGAAEQRVGRLARPAVARLGRVLQVHEGGIVGEHRGGLHRARVGELHLLGIQRVGDHMRFGDHHLHAVLALGLVGAQPQRGRVALVPVDHHDPARARAVQPTAHVHQHRGEHGRPQRERARPGQVVGRDADRPERGDHRAEPGCDPLGDGGGGKGVGAQRQVAAVLLDAARGHHRGAAGGDHGGRGRLG